LNKKAQKKDRQNETPRRNAQKSDTAEPDDKPGRLQQIENSVKNGEYLPHSMVKRTTLGK
jgi:hypothetical protein